MLDLICAGHNEVNGVTIGTSLQVASIFANFNGWNFQWLEQIFNRLNFLPIFAKPNGWKNPMVEPVSNG